MGGGDLNLKKSWHPSTLRNIERVWKAEQKHDAEQKKIEQLQKELAEEKAKEDMRQFAENQGVVKRKNDRLDWMYQGPAALVDREQYLMGRRVDTTFEILEKMENKEQSSQDDILQPGAIFAQSTVNVTVDLANKIREDPLFAIRKHETEQMKSLLTNPVKMKQIRQMLQQSVSEKDKEKKKKKKSKKEKKKRRRSKSESSEKEESPPKKSTYPEKKAISEGHRVNHNDDHDNKHKARYNKPYGLIMGERTRERISNGTMRPRSRSPVQRKSSYDSKARRRSRSPPRRKLTSEEMEQRRREMMADAKWRKDQCSNNVKRYKEEDEKEELRNNKERSRGKESQFYKPMLNKAADTGTVESRVKQKVYNIQRSRSAMNENFARR